MGAVIASDRVFEPFATGKNSFLHGITFGGHPVSSAIALANLDVFEDEGLLEQRARQRGRLRGDARLAARHPDRRRRARDRLLLGGRAGPRPATKETFTEDECEWLLRDFLLGRRSSSAGLICRADDRGDPVIQLAPPLIAGPEQFEEIRAVAAPGARGGLAEARPGSDRVLLLRDLIRDLDIRLVAGEAGLDRPVRWVHISELADPTPWLSGGELLLTTGMNLAEPRGAARVRRAARGARPRRARARRRLRARRDARGAARGRGRARTSRSSRSPTTSRSSR